MPHGLSLASLPRTGGPLGPSSQSGSGSADALADTDFVAWALRVAPECRNLHLHTPVGTTLAIAFIMLSPGRLISFQQAHSVMECCGLVEGPHEWCLTLSTTSRVPKPVYEALLGTLYSDLVRGQAIWQYLLQGHDDPRCLWISFRTEVASRA